MTVSPHGIYPMLYAFYDGDGALSRDAMRRQVDWCIEAGAHGIAVLGLMTEVSWLSVTERLQVIEWAAQDIGGRVPLAVTIAGETPQAQTQLARSAERSGADWLVLQPPQSYKPDEAALMHFFGDVMEATQLAVGVQNFPEVLGVGLSPEGVGALHRQHDNFTVMKGEGPVYQIRRYLDASNGEIGIFNGRGGFELPDNLRAGCAGIIPAPDCMDVQVGMHQAFVAGNHERMDTLYARTLPYVVFIMQSVSFALAYGKRIAARRIGLDETTRSRDDSVKVDAFGLERLNAHAAWLDCTSVGGTAGGI
ncbi:MAG: dihydrodipicolinate synthase family protein [Chromatiales bacterium]|jgi:2-keto-3-deoxy-L-arabinonate dehydratase|nr:dihydrodipicolinate synthase family protein [Chromatiales bacterium]